jgi:hypothetical protein
MILLLTFTVNRAIIVTVKSKQQPREGRKDHTMTYNHTITKAAEIIGVALVSAGIAADGWTMQIISAAAVAADADRYTVAVYQPRHRIPSAVWALTIDTAHDGWTIAARTMECIYNRDTMGADIAPRHALASAITGRIRITAPAAETETTETTETAPAAEPETETETAERAAEIADALDDIRRERVAYSYGYRAKQRVTARCLREAERAGRPTVRVGYCDLYGALSGIDPDYYTAGVYGWNCDVYVIAGLAICTGYRPAAGVRAVGVRELAEACRGADTATRDRLFAAWIVTNRERAREGARA